MRFKKPKPVGRPRIVEGARRESADETQNVKGVVEKLQRQLKPTPAVPAIPAYCESCGVLFGARVFGGSGTITFISSGTNCPNCGKLAALLDGTFHVENETLSLLSGPKFTRDALKLLGKLVERAARKEISLEDLEHKATELDADLGAIVGRAIKSKAGIASLILLLILLRTCNFNVSVDLDINKLWSQISKEGVIYNPLEVNHESDKANPASKSAKQQHK